MSRIGNKPITVPAEVKVIIDGHKITVKFLELTMKLVIEVYMV